MAHNCFEIPNGGRALTAADLGLEGSVQTVKGVISVEGKVMTVNVQMLEGSITNPMAIIGNLKSIAAANGAETIVISASVVNPELYSLLVRRYGLTSVGGQDFIVIPVGK